MEVARGKVNSLFEERRAQWPLPRCFGYVCLGQMLLNRQVHTDPRTEILRCCAKLSEADKHRLWCSAPGKCHPLTNNSSIPKKAALAVTTKKLDQDLLITNNISKKRNRYQHYFACKTQICSTIETTLAIKQGCHQQLPCWKDIASHHLCFEFYCPHQDP